MTRRVGGSVKQVRCSACAAAFPTFTFSGDTDVVTNGLVAVTDIETGLLALGEANGEEWRAGYDGGRRLLAERIGRELGRRMAVVDVARYEQRPGSVAGHDLSGSRRAYGSPEAVYVCPACGSDARIEKQQSPDAFKDSGGELVLVDGLTL